ncbi:hypothetical protein FRC03_004802 [Tulasnella sp. 419]|nr:hypothetical protein FRC03_004802 [Tulasnella sp. 419]
MPFNAVTRSISRKRANRESQVSVSIIPPSPNTVEEDDIIIRFDFDPKDSSIHYAHPMSPEEESFDIGDLPMAILTRGASSQDPVTMISPHVHVIYGRRISIDDGAAPPNRSSCSRGSMSGCKPSTSTCANPYQRTPRLLRRRSSARFSSFSALEHEHELSIISKSVYQVPEVNGASRPISIRRQKSTSSLTSAPLPPIKPLQIRRRKSRANCGVSLDTVLDSFPPLPPTASPTQTMFPDYQISPTERWSMSTSTPIDWDFIEATLGCRDVKLTDAAKENAGKQDMVVPKCPQSTPKDDAQPRQPLSEANIDSDSFLDVGPEPQPTGKLERRKGVIRRKGRCS